MDYGSGSMTFDIRARRASLSTRDVLVRFSSESREKMTMTGQRDGDRLCGIALGNELLGRSTFHCINYVNHC